MELILVGFAAVILISYLSCVIAAIIVGMIYK